MCTCIRRLHYKARIQSGLFATWPEFWAIGLSFLDTFAFSLDTLLAHSAPPPLNGPFLFKNLGLNLNIGVDAWGP